MTGLLLAAAATTGTYLLYTALVLGRRGLRLQGGVDWSSVQERIQLWMVHSGLSEMRTVELVGAVVVLGGLGAFVGLLVFGAVVPALALAGAVGLGWPAASCRLRRERLRTAAQDAWPRIIEEIRLLTGNVGRSIPQALLEAGQRGPAELRPAFAAAQREWLLSTDFERTVALLKARLADPTADAACETLLVAHQVGGSDVARRLEALVEDRVLDQQTRKDAAARQAGVRFSRLFVLLVPAGMAVMGLSIGSGRAAYQSSWGQSMVLFALGVVGACWVWAGRMLRVPAEERVFR